MAKQNGLLDAYDISLYDYELTKKNIRVKFAKYRRLKEQEEKLLFEYKSAADLEITGIKNNKINDNMLARMAKLEPIQNLLKKVDDIVNENKKELNPDEHLIFDKMLLDECTNEDLMDLMQKNSTYINKVKKSCFIKVARWFGEEVYDLNTL